MYQYQVKSGGTEVSPPRQAKDVKTNQGIFFFQSEFICKLQILFCYLFVDKILSAPIFYKYLPVLFIHPNQVGITTLGTKTEEYRISNRKSHSLNHKQNHLSAQNSRRGLHTFDKLYARK